MTAWLLMLLCCLLGSHSLRAQDGAEPEYTVQNPTGFPPPIARKALAPRPADLAGRTIYLVDVTFDNGDLLLLEMQKWLAANRLEIKTEFRAKKGFYAADDPDLWQEIKANNGVMIMAIGH